MRHRRVELYCGAQLGGEVARVLQEEIQTGLQVFALLEKLDADVIIELELLKHY